MEYTDKQELAFHYVHGLLDDDAKMQVFQLVLNDQEFIALLKDEFELVRSMRLQFRHSPDEDRKAEWFESIKAQIAEQDETAESRLSWVQVILEMTMPPLAYHTLNQIQRRWM